MRKFNFVAAAASTAVLLLVAPATATTNAGVDAYDVADSRGDIVTTGADYRDDLVTLSFKTASPEAPTSFNWVYNNTNVIFDIDVNFDGVEDFDVFYYHDGYDVVTTVRNDVSFVETCPGSEAASFSDGYHFVQFPASCIGTPASFQVRTYLYYETSITSYYDFAPGLSFCCAVSRTVTVAPPPPPPPAPQPDPILETSGTQSGYWMITEGGEVSGFGGARDFGDVPAITVDIEPTPTMNGYWVLAKNGSVYTKGDAPYFAGAALRSGEEAASLSATPSGKGYWIFTTKGRVIAAGDATHFGDMSGVTLNGPVLDSVATPSGQGYWMVGSDGGIFSFGDAKFSGSTGDLKLNKPVMSMTPDPDGTGYWLVASDGGIFAFDAPFYGSMGSTPLNKPVSGIVGGPAGYLMVAEDGGIFAFGNVAFHGSLGSSPPARPVVAVALKPAT